MIFLSAKNKFIKTLRYLERYTKTDMVYLSRNGFWSLLNQGIGSISSLAVVFILANMLTKDSFGQYRFVLSAVSLLTIFTLPGIGTTLLRSVARGSKIQLQKIAKVKIIWSTLASLASIFVALYYFNAGNSLLGYSLLVTALFLPFVETFYIYIAYYKGKQDFKTAAIYDSLSRIFQAAVILVTAFITHNVIVLIISFFVGQLIARFFFYKKTIKLVQVDIHQQNDFLPDDTISYGKSLSLTSITSTIQGNIDKLLIWHFLGAESLAIYYIALTIPHNISLLFNVVPRIALPKFSNNTWEPHEHAKVIRKIVLFFITLILPAIIYILLAPYFIPVFFRSYGSSVLPGIILGGMIVLSPVGAMIEQVLSAKKEVKKIIALQIVELLVFACIFLLTYKTYGINGAAIALVSSAIASFLIGLFFLR